MKPDDAFEYICRLAGKSYEKLGFNATSEDLPSLLNLAGFTNLHYKQINVPIGGWESNSSLQILKKSQKAAVLNFIGTLLARPFRALGISTEKAHIALYLARHAIEEQDPASAPTSEGRRERSR